jgi:hypothetical protein
MKKIIFLLFIMIAGCGYQPLYTNQNQDNFVYQKITSNGEKDINEKIINSLKLKEDKNNFSNKILLLDSSSFIQETSKNTKGQVTSYRSNVKVNLIIKKNNKIIKKKDFIKSFNYSNLDNKFNLTKYQSEIKNNLINTILEEIVIYINS